MQIQFIRHLLPYKDQENIRLHAKQFCKLKFLVFAPTVLIRSFTSFRVTGKPHRTQHSSRRVEGVRTGHQGGQEVDILGATHTIARATAYSGTYRTVDVWWQEKFQTNSSVHNINTRNKHNFHIPVANLSCFQKGASYFGIRIFNSLPRSITNLKNEKTQFKVAF